MPDRLRALLERPLDPRIVRAVLALALAVFVGLAALALVALGTGGVGRGSFISAHGEAMPAPSSARPKAGSNAKARAAVPGQDPRDRLGSAAARAARRKLRGHRALQHVPYERRDVSITLVGARRGQALLRVRAENLAAARLGWRRFLDRYDDEGAGYRPIFESGDRNG